MPSKPLRPCGKPGCPNLTRWHPRCEKHREEYDAQRLAGLRQAMARSEQNRGSARERGYTKRWERYRKGFLQRHPLCRSCEAQGRTTAANVVDHIIPHKGDVRLFWDVENHQPLCTPCHNRKTISELGANRGGRVESTGPPSRYRGR